MATFDIHFQINPEDEQSSSNSKLFSFGFTSAVGVKGPQKLINRWLKCLFTPKGTDPLHREYGTGYADLIGSNTSGIRDFTDDVTLFVSDCNDQITALDQKNFPPTDERLGSAVVTNIVPRGDSGYDIYVSIKNAAGTVLTTLLPAGSTRA